MPAISRVCSSCIYIIGFILFNNHEINVSIYSPSPSGFSSCFRSEYAFFKSATGRQTFINYHYTMNIHETLAFER